MMTSVLVSGKNRAKFHFLLISLCIHAIAFIFMGSFVLHNDQEPRESVSVQLLKSAKQTQKMRRNILESPVRMTDRASLPKKSQDIARPAISQSDTSEYIYTEVTPIFQYDYVEARQSGISARMPGRASSVDAPKIEISKPVVDNTIAHNPQESILKIYEQLSDLSSIQNSIDIPDLKPSDPTILKDFLRTIGRKIEKSKRYPRWARDARIEGRVVVRFSISHNGQLSEHPQLVTSSGAEILDNAAIAAIKSAAPFPALPASLSREILQVELPMSFRLNESRRG